MRIGQVGNACSWIAGCAKKAAGSAIGLAGTTLKTAYKVTSATVGITGSAIGLTASAVGLVAKTSYGVGETAVKGTFGVAASIPKTVKTVSYYVAVHPVEKVAGKVKKACDTILPGATEYVRNSSYLSRGDKRLKTKKLSKKECGQVIVERLKEKRAEKSQLQEELRKINAKYQKDFRKIDYEEYCLEKDSLALISQKDSLWSVFKGLFVGDQSKHIVQKYEKERLEELLEKYREDRSSKQQDALEQLKSCLVARSKVVLNLTALAVSAGFIYSQATVETDDDLIAKASLAAGSIGTYKVLEGIAKGRAKDVIVGTTLAAIACVTSQYSF